MKVLITGAKGQLGTTLSRMIREGKCALGIIGAIYQNCEITAVDVDELDIADFDQVHDFLTALTPDIIFNCAAMTNVDGCEENDLLAMKINAVGPRNLGILAAQIGAKLVHISTDYVFRGDAESPYCEWDICNPKTIYGKSKLLGEAYVTQFCSRYYIVRTAWLYGRTGHNFVKTILRLGSEKDEIRVVNDQRGNPTNAEDLAYHLLKLADSTHYGLYHCSGDGECSWFDFAAKIIEYANLDCTVLPCTTEEYLRPAPRPAFSSLNNSMLKVTVGDEMRPWEAALKQYIKQSSNGEVL